MNKYFADLHIHIGRTETGKPVKITGSKSLTLANILEFSDQVKGMNIVGIIDCHVPEVLKEIQSLITADEAYELTDGGVRYNNTTLILGSEIEIYDQNCKGPIHVLVFMPTIEKMIQWSNWMNERVTNITLSSQRIYEDAKTLQQKAKSLGGLFIIAHAFTPFKSLYGKGVEHSLTEVFNPSQIDAVELGLSSNTSMADQIPELHQYSFLSNSDAHSLEKIAREYQVLQLIEPTFEELRKALHKEDNRKILANYGLNPSLGKYHRTSCEKCFYQIENNRYEKCPNCGHHRFTKGVWDRLQELKQVTNNVPERPPYIHQVPLEFLSGMGPKTLAKLRDYFKTDMSILHDVSPEQLYEYLPKPLAEQIILSRKGMLKIHPGGGGKYGKVNQKKS